MLSALPVTHAPSCGEVCCRQNIAILSIYYLGRAGHGVIPGDLPILSSVEILGGRRTKQNVKGEKILNVKNAAGEVIYSNRKENKKRNVKADGFKI